MTKSRVPTATVMGLRDWQPDGHIIPHAWGEHLIFDNGQPNDKAIRILSDVVYLVSSQNHCRSTYRAGCGIRETF